MQQVFDAMVSAQGMVSVDELCQRSGLGRQVVLDAIRRLRLWRKLRGAEKRDGVWVYGAKPRTERPEDRRGR